jgi:hypothetical protein
MGEKICAKDAVAVCRTFYPCSVERLFQAEFEYATQASADTAPRRAEIQRIDPNKLEPVNVAVVPLD